MTALEPFLVRWETLFFLLNLIVVVSLTSGAGLVRASIFRRGSLSLRHDLLLAALAVMLLSPPLVWLGQRTGVGLIQIAAGTGRVDVSQATQRGPTPPTSLRDDNDDAMAEPSRPVDVAGDATANSPSAKAAVPPAANEPVDFVDASPGLGGGDVSSESETSQPGLPPAHTERVEVASLSLREAGDGPVSPPWRHVAGSLLVGIWLIGILVSLVMLGRGLMLVGRLRRSLEQPADAHGGRLARKAARLLRLPTACRRSPCPRWCRCRSRWGWCVR